MWYSKPNNPVTKLYTAVLVMVGLAMIVGILSVSFQLRHTHRLVQYGVQGHVITMVWEDVPEHAGHHEIPEEQPIPEIPAPSVAPPRPSVLTPSASLPVVEDPAHALSAKGSPKKERVEEQPTQQALPVKLPVAPSNRAEQPPPLPSPKKPSQPPSPAPKKVSSKAAEVPVKKEGTVSTSPQTSSQTPLPVKKEGTQAASSSAVSPRYAVGKETQETVLSEEESAYLQRLAQQLVKYSGPRPQGVECCVTFSALGEPVSLTWEKHARIPWAFRKHMEMVVTRLVTPRTWRGHTIYWTVI